MVKLIQSLLLVPLIIVVAWMCAQGLDQDRKEPIIIGDKTGIDGGHCESAKAEFDLIASVADERDSNVIIISRLGEGEHSRSVARLRLAQVKNHLMMVRGYSSDRVVTAEGERVKGLGLVEIYIKGKPFIIYRMKRNGDFIRGNFGC